MMSGQNEIWTDECAGAGGRGCDNANDEVFVALEGEPAAPSRLAWPEIASGSGHWRGSCSLPKTERRKRTASTEGRGDAKSRYYPSRERAVRACA
jgi:hypothetical protein